MQTRDWLNFEFHHVWLKITYPLYKKGTHRTVVWKCSKINSSPFILFHTTMVHSFHTIKPQLRLRATSSARILIGNKLYRQSQNKLQTPPRREGFGQLIWVHQTVWYRAVHISHYEEQSERIVPPGPLLLCLICLPFFPFTGSGFKRYFITYMSSMLLSVFFPSVESVLKAKHKHGVYVFFLPLNPIG